MSGGIIEDLPTYLQVLKKEGELLEIDLQVDPHLEIAEIHRRVIARGGPALLFTNVHQSRFPVATNLFGTSRRMELAFGSRPQQFVRDLVRAAETIAGRRVPILTGNGGTYLPQELGRGADGAMTGFAYPEMLVEVVRRHQERAWREADHAELTARAEAELVDLRDALDDKQWATCVEECESWFSRRRGEYGEAGRGALR